MKKTTTMNKRKTMAPPQPKTPNNAQADKKVTSFSCDRSVCSNPQRKASTPTHEQTTGSDSPDISRILPSEINTENLNKKTTKGRPQPRAILKPGSNEEFNLQDKLDLEYSRYLQTLFMKKLEEAKASEIDDNLTNLQKRIAENQNILQKTSERLKNITFNKEVEALHKLRNPNYGKVLETLDKANCKEYLETLNKKLEQSHNQLKTKNIEMPQGGGAELLEVIKETLASCEKLKANNNLEVPKVVADIKAANNITSEHISRCLQLVPEVEDVLLTRAALEISSHEEQ